MGSRPDSTKRPMCGKETKGFLLLESVSVQNGRKWDSRGQAFTLGWQPSVAGLFTGYRFLSHETHRREGVMESVGSESL